MKKIALLLTMVVALATSSMAQLISVTATKKDGTTISGTVFKLNPEYIMYVKKATTPTIGYQDLTRPERVMEYVVTDHFDSVVNRANYRSARLVKVQVSSMVAGTSRDTVIYWAFPLKKILEVKAKTKESQPSMNSEISIQQVNRFTKIWSYETPAEIQARLDSLWVISNGRDNVTALSVKHGTHDTVRYTYNNAVVNDTIKR